MQDEIIKKETNETTETEQKRTIMIADLRDEAERAREDMETARMNFNRVNNFDDVDIYIYKLRSAESRYTKLIKKLKELS